jgi:membrane protease YdiL (CAAX protease family)
LRGERVPGGAVETNWASVGWLIALTIAGAFAALWAQGAPVNRGMRSALYATVLFVGFLLLLVGLLGVVFPGSAPAGLLVPGVVICLPCWRPLRQLAARAMPIDPGSVTHTVALIVVLLVLLFGAAKLVYGGQAAAAAPVSAVEAVAQHLALAVIAFFAVGLGLRRTWAAALDRLGLVRPSLPQLGLAVLTALLLAAIALGLRTLAPAAPPADALALALAGQAGAPVAGLAVALSAALGMEILFRGALQPRIGLPVTALAFIALVILPPLTTATLGLVAVAVALGLLRRWTNTTTCIVAHALAGAALVLAPLALR